MFNNFGSGWIALAAIIGLLLLACNRRRAMREALLIVLAVLIVCGCSCQH